MPIVIRSDIESLPFVNHGCPDGPELMNVIRWTISPFFDPGPEGFAWSNELSARWRDRLIWREQPHRRRGIACSIAHLIFTSSITTASSCSSDLSPDLSRFLLIVFLGLFQCQSRKLRLRLRLRSLWSTVVANRPVVRCVVR